MLRFGDIESTFRRRAGSGTHRNAAHERLRRHLAVARRSMIQFDKEGYVFFEDF